jgi:hypothetical protein
VAAEAADEVASCGLRLRHEPARLGLSERRLRDVTVRARRACWTAGDG